ncbi:MAG: NeuD/PglB/VioB family sugar acetyltransferase [Muribaculaceae bacterium]|nr:NeuD/PglB/VioB family sugar acetyltransferase [Muribaculaceae bacterium]MBR5743722.1 NeuD/PglB/VioB family sugar acetyltransferase [Muribaculaceae bacterium]
MMFKQKKLILVGGGGHCRSVADVALSANCRIMGIIDPNVDVEVFGAPRLGDDFDVADVAARFPEAEFVVTTGHIKSSSLRRHLVKNLEDNGCRIASPIIANDAYIGLCVSVGDGSVVMHRAVVNANSSIGTNAIINTGAIVDHDCTIGNFCHLSTRSVVNGGCRIGNGVFLGSGAVVAQKVTICDDVVIGAGAVVVDDITVSGTYLGVPAVKVK